MTTEPSPEDLRQIIADKETSFVTSLDKHGYIAWIELLYGPLLPSEADKAWVRAIKRNEVNHDSVQSPNRET